MPDLHKLTQLSVPTSICQWITSFLTDRQQLVRLGKLSSRTLTISTGAPQGCVLSPLLFSLYTNDCTSKDPSIKLLKFADDTTVIGLIKDGDESAYRQEVEQLAVWCSLNNLELNTLKTVEMIVDFRRNPPALPPLTIMNSTVTAVESFRFLGTTISQDLKWDNHIDYRKKGPAEAVFPPPAKEVQPASGAADTVLLCHHRVCPMFFYNCWFGSATKTDIRRLQRTVRTAERIIKNCTPPEWGKGLRKSLWTPHTQLTLSLYCCPLAGATDHWAQKQFFPPGHIPPEQHITPPGTVHL